MKRVIYLSGVLFVGGLFLGFTLRGRNIPSDRSQSFRCLDARSLNKHEMSRYLHVTIDFNSGVFPRGSADAELLIRIRNVSKRSVIVKGDALAGHPSSMWVVRNSEGHKATVRPFKKDQSPALLFRPGQEAVFYSGWPNCPELKIGTKVFRPGHFFIETAHFKSNALPFEVLSNGELDVAHRIDIDSDFQIDTG